LVLQLLEIEKEENLDEGFDLFTVCLKLCEQRTEPASKERRDLFPIDLDV